MSPREEARYNGPWLHRLRTLCFLPEKPPTSADITEPFTGPSPAATARQVRSSSACKDKDESLLALRSSNLWTSNRPETADILKFHLGEENGHYHHPKC